MRRSLGVREVFSFEECRDNLADLVSLDRGRDNIDEDV
jgi:hypothetical protein